MLNEDPDAEGPIAEDPKVTAIKERLLAIPQIAQWPEMAAVVRSGRRNKASIPCWEYPILSCEAVGGDAAEAMPGMVATVCLLNSIHLIDDMLDDDPEGLYHELGSGAVANIAAAFQAAAIQALAEVDLPSDRLTALYQAVGRGGLATAHGQYIDSSPFEGDPEEAYWRAALGKTPPLFGAAFFMGAVLGGADLETASRLEGLALHVGKIIQAGDDMGDALEVPPDTDWTTRWNNLVILYALVADHPDKARFVELADRHHEPEALAEAQEILVRSGAISYGCYHVIDGYRRGRDALAALDLPHPERFGRLFEELIEPARQLFANLGIEPPDELYYTLGET